MPVSKNGQNKGSDFQKKYAIFIYSHSWYQSGLHPGNGKRYIKLQDFKITRRYLWVPLRQQMSINGASSCFNPVEIKPMCYRRLRSQQNI